MCVESFENNRAVLWDLQQEGYRYIVVRDDSQARLVLDNSPFTTYITHRSGEYDGDSNLYLFEIDKKAMQGAIVSAKYRRNAEDEEDDWEPEGGVIDLTPPDEHFERKKIMAYGATDWAESWWREAIQNAVDACRAVEDKRKGVIFCEVWDVEDSDKVMVTVTDNGIGMDRRTVIKNFLTKGGTLKPAGATGGLGMAKELLLFSFPRWSIHSRKEGISANSAVLVNGRYDPNYYKPYLRKGQEPIPDEYRGCFLGKQRKEQFGTKLEVVMKKGDAVSSDELKRFLGLSHLDGILVKYREGVMDKQGNRLREGPWERIEAKNKIPATADPIKTLVRRWGPGFGSVWARIYHMPHARKFKEIIVRINNLYMFTAPGEFNVTGKVIIELEYLPRGRSWDEDTQQWKPLPAGTTQKSTEYGPAELIQESRKQLQTQYQRQLDAILQEISKDEHAFLRSREATIVRTKNKASRQREWDEIMELVSPRQLYSGDENEVSSNINQLGEAEVSHTVGRIVQLVEGEVGPDLNALPPKKLAKVIENAVTDGEINQNDIAKLQRILQQQGMGSDVVAHSGLGAAISELETSIDTSADFGFWGQYILPKLFKVAEAEEWGASFINNAINFLHWEPDFILYDEVGGKQAVVSAELEDKESYNPNRDKYGRLYPKAPKKFQPQSFGQKEKRLAKFWTEILRFAFIVMGTGSRLIRSESGLHVGFHFENPPENNKFCPSCEIEYRNTDLNNCPKEKWDGSICGEPLEKLQGEKAEWLGCYRRETGSRNPEHNFKGIFITPAEMTITPKSSGWKHRYKVDRRREDDISMMTAIGFHEVAHALNLKGMGHDVEFASILTFAIPHIYRFKEQIRALINHVASLYPLRTTGAAADTSQSPKYLEAMARRSLEAMARREEVAEDLAEKMSQQTGREVTAEDLIDETTGNLKISPQRRLSLERGGGRSAPRKRFRPGERQGFYKVKCERKRGRPKPMERLADAMAHADEYIAEYPERRCDITAYYRDRLGAETEIGHVTGRTGDDGWEDSGELLETLHNEWEDSWQDEIGDRRPGNQIFFRKKRMLRRRNSG